MIEMMDLDGSTNQKQTNNIQPDYPHLKHPKDEIDYIFQNVLPAFGYSVREEQIKLSQKMLEGFRKHKVSMNEAEVGTGKSLAYLVAAFVAKSRWNDSDTGPITIATSSIELQNALITKEIPRLSDMLMASGRIRKPLRTVLRKGKEHYLCYLRFRDYLEKISQHKRKYKLLIQELNDLDVSVGDVFDLDKSGLRPSVKEKICVKSGCKECKYATECGYQNFLERAKNDSHLFFQVTNHNMYLASIKARMNGGEPNAVLQPSDYVILDEAHKFSGAAEDTFGESFSEQAIPEYIELVKCLCNQYDPTGYKRLLRRLKATNDLLFSSLRERVEENENEDNNQKGSIIRLNRGERDCLQELSDTIYSIEKLREKGEKWIPGFAQTIQNALDELSKCDEMNEWVSIDENNVASLCCSPKEIAPILHHCVWNRPVHHVLTSGTMSDGIDFGFFENENGINRLQRCEVQTSTTPSPFDYEAHTRLYIPHDIPFPDNDDEEYKRAIADRIVKLVEATNGHTTILFTSYHVLQAVYELTKDRLGKYDVICMSRSNKTAISEFKKSPNGVFFASGSMWEGVDCVGDCLSSVIIVRLPFPLRSAAMEQKKEQCSDVRSFINKYAVPEMMIKLRQGMGRLIRSESDTGLIAILDRRADNMNYRMRLQSVLAKYPRVKNIEDVRTFFESVKSKQYFEAKGA